MRTAKLFILLNLCVWVQALTSDITVSTSAELLDALSAAAGGEVIQLESGFYGRVDFHYLDFSSPVTIISADGDRGARFEAIEVEYTSNIIFDSVTVDFGSNLSENNPFGLVTIRYGCEHIILQNSEIYGKVDDDFLGGRGVRIDDADYITVHNNYIHDVADGMTIFGSANIEITENTVEDIRQDGFKVGGVTGILLENNTGPRFRHPQPGDHKDFIQFQGTASDIVIRGNVSLPGFEVYNQGIFMDDAVYTNVLIEENIIYCGNGRGISCSEGSGIIVRYNTVLTPPDWGEKAAFISVPPGSVVEYNVASHNANNDGISGTNHVISYDSSSDDPLNYNNYYQNALTGTGLTLEDLRPVPGSPADGEVGAYERILELLDGISDDSDTETDENNTDDPDVVLSNTGNSRSGCSFSNAGNMGIVNMLILLLCVTAGIRGWKNILCK